MKKIYVALPAYTGTVRVETTQALMHEAHAMWKLGWDMTLRISAGDSILPRARNHFIADFLERKEYTDLVFLDHDVAWEKGALIQLCKHDVDVVAGIYPKRTIPTEWPVRVKDGTSFADPENGLLECEGVPAGFLRITRRCLRAMTDHYWHLRYNEPHAPGKIATSLFDFAVYDGAYWGEDFVFCKRWRDMGGKVWADPEIFFAHCGTWNFTGKLGDEIRERAGRIHTGPKDEPEEAKADNVQRIELASIDNGNRVRVKAGSSSAA